MSKSEKTDWMDARAFVQYVDENNIQTPMYAWRLVELLRMHSAAKFVMETGHPLHPRTSAGPGRPVIRYTFHKQVTDSIVGGVCKFRIIKKQLSPREWDRNHDT